MRLAIVSDCHFGFNEDALPQAKEALEKSIELGADAIVLPGDIYDTRVPKQETVHETIGLFSHLQQETVGKYSTIRVEEEKAGKLNPIKVEGIPTLAIWGTHERRSKGLSNIIQILDAAGMAISFHTRKILLEKDGEKVCLQGLGGVPEEYFRRTLEVADFHPMKDAFNIFVFHQNLKELLPIEREEDVSIDELPAGFDLYVNGHIHWNHDLKIRGRHLLVSGSTVVTQMKKNEEKPKGFYLFDTKARTADFVKIASRPFFFRELEFSNATARDVDAALQNELEGILRENFLKKPQIKIKLAGTVKKSEAAALNIDKITRKFSDRAAIFIDKEFGSDDLKQKIETIRSMRAEGKNARELGMEILRQKIKEKKLEVRHPDELFELLSEGEIEEAISAI